MFRKIRIAVLLLILFAVVMDTWLTRAFSTDWQERLYIAVYPINADGSAAAERYIERLEPGTGLPLAPHGLAEPDRRPLYPQTRAEIMGGRIALSAHEAEIPKSLRYAIIGPETAAEIRLTR